MVASTGTRPEPSVDGRAGVDGAATLSRLAGRCVLAPPPRPPPSLRLALMSGAAKGRHPPLRTERAHHPHHAKCVRWHCHHIPHDDLRPPPLPSHSPPPFHPPFHPPLHFLPTGLGGWAAPRPHAAEPAPTPLARAALASAPRLHGDVASRRTSARRGLRCGGCGAMGVARPLGGGGGQPQPPLPQSLRPARRRHVGPLAMRLRGGGWCGASR